MNEENLEKNINLAEKVIDKKGNPDDVLTLLTLPRDEKPSFTKEYIMSVIIAPFGVYYCIKLYLNEDTKPAIVCLVITIIMTLIYWKLGTILLGSFGTSIPMSPSNYNLNGL